MHELFFTFNFLLELLVSVVIPLLFIYLLISSYPVARGFFFSF